MAACEKCWTDSRGDFDRYQELLKQRDDLGLVCTPKQRAGMFWDEENQCDEREIALAKAEGRDE
jgi:hypothetical protein